MEDASVVPILDPLRRPSFGNKYDPMKFIPSDEVEAGILESNLKTIDDANDDAEVNTKTLILLKHKTIRTIYFGST